MSVQLILYPQNYDGQFNSIASVSNEFVVDGLNFNTINTSGSYDSSTSGNVILDVLTNQPPLILNSWYRFRSTALGTPDLPVETSGNLVLESAVGGSLSGVYQRLSNLVVGTAYEMVIDIDQTSAAGDVFTGAFNGTNMILQPSDSASNSQITFTWTAATVNDTIVISYLNFVNDTISISKISVSPQGLTPTTIYTDLEDGQVICDLYEDEDIPLSLSVDDFKNVAEKVQSYSKAFNLPATKRNNLIFDNIFEITRTDTGINFNPYKRTQCVLKQDGFILFEGYLRLIDISDKEGEISYNINLYSEVVALADVLKDSTFSELDFTELTHDYNRTNIIRSWRNSGGGTSITYTNPDTSGFRDDYTTLRYPFVDWSHQIAVGGSNAPNATVGNPELLTLEAAFRPFINIKYLIDRIFDETPFTYESTFFNTADFKKLYMDFNWGSENTPVTVLGSTYEGYYMFGTGDGSGANVATTSFTEMILSYNIPVIGGITPPNYNDVTNIITSTVINESYNINYSYSIKNTDSSARTVECQWLYNSTPINNTGTVTIGAGATYVFSGSFTQLMTNIGDTLKAQFKASTGSVVEQLQNAFPSSGAYVVFNFGVAAITTNVILQTLRGELGQWDFLKGLMTMFNLVSIPDKDNPSNILIEPYADVFINNTASGTTSDLSLASRGIAHDWTDKIDIAEIKLTPLTDLNKKTIFKFVEDDDDYAFMNFKNSVGGHLYGSKLQDEVFYTVLDGEKEIIAEPFAATVPKPLMEQFSDFITPAIYARANEGTWEGFENSPRIMFNNGVKTLTACGYYIPAQNGVAEKIDEDEFLQFSHLTDIPTIAGTKDFHFGQCQLIEGIGSSVPDNLFSLYWQPYYNELYNPDTRTMTLKVNLSPADINTFNFFDTVMIKNRQFRVNKIDYKPNDLATVEFILVP